MSGHSKWSTIKRKKGAADAKKGQSFSKISRMITIAAKEGGPDPNMNFKLRLAIDKAKEMNMPSSTVDRAIAGASKEGAQIEEITYEAYGPSGIALLIQAVTDNKNRASAEVKAVLNKYNGSLGGPGSVSWMFEKKGLVVLDKQDVPEEKKDDLELLAIDLGAQDIKDEEGSIEVYTTPEDIRKISKGISDAGFKIASESFEMDPKNTVAIADENKAAQILKLVDGLEELEDVDQVYSNFDISSEILEKLS